MDHYKSAFSFYARHWKKVLLFGITILLPLSVIETFVSNYFFNLFSLVGLPTMGSFPQFIFSTVFLMIAQIPFIYLVRQEITGQNATIGQAFEIFFTNMFPVYVMGVLLALLTIAGTMLLIIPGLIILTLLIVYPYVVVSDELRWFNGLKKTVEIVKNHFFSVLGVTMVAGILTMVINFLFLFATLLVTKVYWMIVLVQLLLKMLIVPYFTFLIGSCFEEWYGFGYEEEYSF
ncbi:hypothetical protein [Thermoactinomyces mirandus]|uniref:Glycerophosphoryl diester phosphodiesterase membrane domain-containing protein n=1 Tax=Thermoactinomyces mirandus TaxID=2756294 RepID=A0A7W1XV77_9BACL|nr:hypothetical protein [Thermoactinomyces mirandus]MBA4603912.1 hypothetical protein [Thermoactinomyces mirandus]